MTQKSIKTRTALTAIVAVIALSSTPALAQETSAPDPADSTRAMATPDPLAPEPTTTAAEPVTEATASQSAAEKNIATKVRPAARGSASAAPPTRSRITERAQAAPPPAAVSAAGAPADTLPPPPAEAPPVAEPVAPPPAETAPAEQAINADEALPIAGAAGLGLLALAGAGLAVRRRRRRRANEEFRERQIALAEAEAAAPPPATPEPAFVRPAAPAHDPVPAKAPATALPKGFDLSKFGRHVQAAYRGPTPDNPSLSLKNRLRRASFFDQRERRVAAEAPTAAKPAGQPAWATRKPNAAEFLFRPAPKQPAPKPEFHK